ncbi:MAG: glycosyltransferase family 4 protein [Sediminimonas qiaohouensis]|uniref:Glycosyltransferase family 4 protein n=1 Tax=Sediminimonas qiaohouensis TaxID=552061 RepID=A0A7C9HDV5_9RHOB|nr:glycosyltransferase [Sediminimonas qiaohouensis]MTJ06087.1 glycosyltransferase family 4 protein [Sediminimonas qiaohouensis]
MPDHRPRIHWVSPLPPAETDIAHYTRRILPELAERAEVTLWTDATTWDRELEQFCRVRSMTPGKMLPKQMRSFDGPGDRSGNRSGDRPGTMFINMGNSWVFHAGLLTLARRMPSVVVLHDLAIQEMCLDAIHNSLLGRQTYFEAMYRWYGEAGRRAAQEALKGRLPATELSQTYPGFEIAMDNAVAVLTHTAAASEAVSARGYVPTYQLDLPFRARDTARHARRMTGPLRFVQFGHIGPNRRLEQVLEALAGMGPGFDFIFDIVGKVWNQELIKARCQELGLSEKVHLHGYVSEPELDALIGQAHLVFNLRHPTMGEASGSQLRIWNAAAASVVSDQGWYHHLPKDTVFHIPVEGEISALQQLFVRLQEDRSFGWSLGLAGRQRLMEHHAPAHYADGIVDVASDFENDARDALFANSARRLLSEGPDTPRLSGLIQNRLAQLF